MDNTVNVYAVSGTFLGRIPTEQYKNSREESLVAAGIDVSQRLMLSNAHRYTKVQALEAWNV
jgi:hypothetical protein